MHLEIEGSPELVSIRGVMIEVFHPANDSLHNASAAIEPFEAGLVTGVVTANEEGPCGGVEMAEAVMYGLIKARRKAGSDVGIYGNHPPSNSADTSAQYEEAGIEFGIEPASIPTGSVYVFSAHGAAPAKIKEASERLIVVNTICPLVEHIYRHIRRFKLDVTDLDPSEVAVIYAATSYDENHPEVRGTRGLIAEAGFKFLPVTTPEEASELVYDHQITLQGIKRALMTGMTTNNSSITKAIANALQTALVEHGYPNDFLKPYDERSVCLTVKHRQDAVRKMIQTNLIENLIIVGALGSNNSRELVKVALDEIEQMPAATSKLKKIIFANTYKDVPPLRGAVGIASGASTQQRNIDGIKQLLNVDPSQVTVVGESAKIGNTFRPVGGKDTIAGRILSGDVSWLPGNTVS